MIGLYLCYFTFGFCMSFGSIALDFEMMERLKFSPVEMSMGYGVIAAPWCIKPVFGWMSDNIPVFDWGKRRPYIFFCGILAAYLYTLMSKFIVTKTSMVAVMTLVSLLVCVADVCADCITVDYAKREPVKGKTQSSCWMARALGSLLGSSFGGVAYEKLGTRPVFQIMAFPSILMALWIWQLKPNLTPAPDNVCKKLWKAVYKKRTLAFSIFLLNIGPNYSPTYTYFLRRELKYTPEDFQWISTAAGISFLLSTIVYERFLLKINQIKLMQYSVFISILCQLLQLVVITGLNTHIGFVVLDTIADSFFGMFLLLPIIVVVAQEAKCGVEGTFYALMMSVSNLSSVFSDELGGLFANIMGVNRDDFRNCWVLVIVCIVIDIIIKLMVLNHPSFVAYWGRKSDRRRYHRTLGSRGNNRGSSVSLVPLHSDHMRGEMSVSNMDSPVNTVDLPVNIEDLSDSAI